jgi:PhnB protein
MGRSSAAPVQKGGYVATEIAVMLAVADAQGAVEFYKKAFGAEVYWTVGGDGHMVAGMAIDGARFFLATESPEFGTRGPSGAGFTTVRIELFVDDPVAVHAKAIAAGGKQHSEVKEHKYPVVGPKPIGRMLQGAVVDPFGHLWLIGKFLD